MEVNHLSLSETFCICTGYIREWRMLLLLVVDSHSWRDGLASATARDRVFLLHYVGGGILSRVGGPLQERVFGK